MFCHFLLHIFAYFTVFRILLAYFSILTAYFITYFGSFYCIKIRSLIIIYQHSSPAFPKLWSTDHRWSSSSALAVFKKDRKKIKFKWIEFHTIGKNLSVWELHMAIVFHSFSQFCHFMRFITPPAYRLPTLQLLSATKEGFKALWPVY